MQTQQNYTQNLQAPIVSFIVTTYNLPIDYIKECLDSILQLSLNPKEREIILIDDGSDICPLNDLAEYLPNIIYLRQPNQGVSVARNYGMKIATGKYIQFIDGDDYILKAAYDAYNCSLKDLSLLKISCDNLNHVDCLCNHLFICSAN